MSEWYSGDVVANGIRIHYTRTGGDKPPLVLCHGATDQGLCWTIAARELQADYDVIMPDARGHGRSEAPAGGDYGTDAQADDLAGLIRALGLGQALVGGHSMGGASSLYLAAYYPELVRGAFLEDPALTVLQDTSLQEREEAAERWRLDDIEQKAMSREQRLAHCREGNPTWSEEELALWADCRPHVAMRFASFFTAVPRVPWRQALAQVKCPVLLLAPEHGLVTPDQANEMARLLPSLTVATIPGTGHCIRRDQPAAYLRVVREFLAAV